MLPVSPKASAALSRRNLQAILRNTASTTEKDVFDQIEEVISSGKLPSHIADLQLGDKGTTVEIDEAYIGGHLRHKGSKVAKAPKTMVIGLAERDGRIHLRCSMPSLQTIPQERYGWQSHLQAPNR